MTIKKKPRRGKLEIDLTGPEGNAFNVLAVARKLCKILGKDWEDIRQRMTSGDYENLIEVFDKEFGDFVTLYK